MTQTVYLMLLCLILMNMLMPTKSSCTSFCSSEKFLVNNNRIRFLFVNKFKSMQSLALNNSFIICDFTTQIGGNLFATFNFTFDSYRTVYCDGDTSTLISQTNILDNSTYYVNKNLDGFCYKSVSIDINLIGECRTNKCLNYNTTQIFNGDIPDQETMMQLNC